MVGYSWNALEKNGGYSWIALWLVAMYRSPHRLVKRLVWWWFMDRLAGWWWFMERPRKTVVVHGSPPKKTVAVHETPSVSAVHGKPSQQVDSWIALW